MKKFLSLGLTVLMLFTLSGCVDAGAVATNVRSAQSSYTVSQTQTQTSVEADVQQDESNTDVIVETGKKETMVWVPTKGGTKYHKKSSCSNMKNPEKTTLKDAKKRGFTACKKCYKNKK